MKKYRIKHFEEGECRSINIQDKEFEFVHGYTVCDRILGSDGKPFYIPGLGRGMFSLKGTNFYITSAMYRGFKEAEDSIHYAAKYLHYSNGDVDVTVPVDIVSELGQNVVPFNMFMKNTEILSKHLKPIPPNTMMFKAANYNRDLFLLVATLAKLNPLAKDYNRKVVELFTEHPQCIREIAEITSFSPRKVKEGAFVMRMCGELYKYAKINYQHHVQAGDNRYLVDLSLQKDDRIVLIEYDENHHERQVSADRQRKENIVSTLRRSFKRGKFFRVKQGEEKQFFKNRLPDIIGFLEA